jgi:hypothetical protein
MENVNILDLAVELIHFIFDHCDTATILSVRCVCKQLYAATNTYNRFQIVFSTKSKFHFKFISRLIRPEYIISLTFSNVHNSQSFIRRFFSLFNIDQFKGLRFVTLHQIRDLELEYFLEHMNTHFWISLSISSNEYQHTRTLSLISSAITRFKLLKLCLNDLDEIMKNISWLNECGLSSLVTERCDYSQYWMVLHQLPHLRTFTMTDCTMHHTPNNVFNSDSTLAFAPSLTSLIISDCSLSTDDLEVLFSLTPTLLHLKLNSRRKVIDSIFDGYYWQQIIQTKLRSLNKFEILFSCDVIEEDNAPSLRSLINRFQAPFWIEEKYWFITCEYVIRLNTIRLYTTPVNLTNFDSAIRCEALSTDNIRYLITQSTNGMADTTMNEVCMRNIFKKIPVVRSKGGRYSVATPCIARKTGFVELIEVGLPIPHHSSLFFI